MEAKRIAGLACALALLAAPTIGFAQAGPAGVYLGGSLGQATAEDFCRPEPGFTVSACDDKAAAWKIYGGYRFGPHLAAELTFIQTDDFSITATSGGLTLPVKVDASSFGLAGLGIWPVGPQFALFGKAGILRTEAEARASIGGATFVAGEDETGLHYGVGALFSFGRNLGLRAEWEKAEKGEYSLWSIGLQWSF